MLSRLIDQKTPILIVDDQQRNLDALEVVLACPQYDLVQALSGQKALDLLTEREFAVILVDVMMPGMDGFECATRIRQSERARGTPIIFVSAVADEMNFIFRGYSAGAIDYIVKPIEPAVVRAKVAIFAELFQARRLLAIQLEETQALCRRLEEQNAEGKHDYDALVTQIHEFKRSLEQKLSTPAADQAPKGKSVLPFQ